MASEYPFWGMGFPYTKKIGSIDVFLNYIANEGIPSKVDRNLLASIGLTSSNDQPLIPLFKELGFIKSDGSPDERWRAYRDSRKAKEVLADGIKDAYPELYGVYPDAHRKDKEAIVNVVKSRTDLGARAVDLVYSTFHALAESADFGGGPVSPKPPKPKEKRTPDPDDGSGALGPPTDNRAPSIAINIQLELPKDADETTYEKLFAAMKKHLSL